MKNVLLAMILATVIGACAAQSNDDDLAILTGGRPPGTNVERIAAQAARHPLGSEQNPVRVNMPPGERAYLARLRCSDGSAPTFERQGSGGASPYGSIMDIYSVACANSEPRQSIIWMDMYHPRHNETAAPAGFTIVTP